MKNVNRKALIEALKKVLPAVSKTGIITALQSFFFKENKIYAYNDELFVSYPFEHDVDSCGVVADELFKILSKLKSADVDLSFKDNEFIIKTKNSMTGIKTVADDISLPLPDDIEWRDLSDDFCYQLKLASDICMKDNSRPLFRYVRYDNKQLSATDGIRAIMVHTNEELDPFYTPSFVVDSLVDYKPNKIAMNNGWLFFQNVDNVIFGTRTISSEENFPNIKQVLGWNGVKISLPVDMENAVENASVFIKEKGVDDNIKIDINDKKMILCVEGQNGWHKEKFEIDEDVTLSFVISPTVLKDALKHHCQVELDEARIKIECDQFSYCGMLKRKGY